MSYLKKYFLYLYIACVLTACQTPQQEAPSDLIPRALVYPMNQSHEGSLKKSLEEEAPIELKPFYWKVDSIPKGAEVFFQVISNDVKCDICKEERLDQTPYEGVKNISVTGLTKKNLKNFDLLVSFRKKGYETQTRRINFIDLIKLSHVDLKITLRRSR